MTLRYFIALASVLMSIQTQAQIFLDEKQVQYKVDRLEMSRIREFSCPRDLQVFHPDDFTENGTLDDLCVGLEYDPCDIHSVQRKIYWAAVTGGCRSLDEIERIARQKAICAQPDFSPRPAICED